MSRASSFRSGRVGFRTFSPARSARSSARRSAESDRREPHRRRRHDRHRLGGESRADGHTLILSAASHTINGSLYAKLPYDPIGDFTGVAHIGTVEYVLMVGAALPVRTVGNSSTTPGRMRESSTTARRQRQRDASFDGVLCGTRGIDLVHVPYKATNEAVNEVVAGRSHAVIAANIGALGFVKDERVRMLGVTSAKRSKFLPELPTIAESGCLATNSIPGSPARTRRDSGVGPWRESTQRSVPCSGTP